MCGGKIKGFCIWSHHWNEVFQGERFYYELMFYYCERIMIHISKHKNEKETCTLMWILICLVICNTTLLIDILPLKLPFFLWYAQKRCILISIYNLIQVETQFYLSWHAKTLIFYRVTFLLFKWLCFQSL